MSSFRIASRQRLPRRHSSFHRAAFNRTAVGDYSVALSLIVVSLEAPKTYGELMETMRGILPFAFCFFIWTER